MGENTAMRQSTRSHRKTQQPEGCTSPTLLTDYVEKRTRFLSTVPRAGLLKEMHHWIENMMNFGQPETAAAAGDLHRRIKAHKNPVRLLREFCGLEREFIVNRIVIRLRFGQFVPVEKIPPFRGQAALRPGQGLRA